MKSANRLADEFQGERGNFGVYLVRDRNVIEFVLEKIRARRDELLEWERRDKFTALFDDGAEFGPDEPVPTLWHESDGAIMVDHPNGRSSYRIPPWAVEAIREGRVRKIQEER